MIGTSRDLLQNRSRGRDSDRSGGSVLEFVDTASGLPPHEAERPVYAPLKAEDVHRSCCRSSPMRGWTVTYRSRHRRPRSGGPGARATFAGGSLSLSTAQSVRAVFYRCNAAFLSARSTAVPPCYHLSGVAPHRGGVSWTPSSSPRTSPILFSFCPSSSTRHNRLHRPYEPGRFLRSLMPRTRLFGVTLDRPPQTGKTNGCFGNCSPSVLEGRERS